MNPPSKPFYDRQDGKCTKRIWGCDPRWCGRRRWGDDRAVREGFEGQPLQDLESDEFGRILPAACARRLHSEEEWRPKGSLGVPTVADRVAQTVVKQMIEPDLDAVFLADSYGYRPDKSALDAVGVTRERCWKYDWVLEFDIKGLFDNIDHELLLRAVRKHVTCPWALLYIERWLTAPMLREDGTLIERTAALRKEASSARSWPTSFMHYTFDLWMARTFPDLPWCRYADDGLVHCRTEKEAQTVWEALHARLAECRLEMHPTKTKIVYCKDNRRKGKYEKVSFDFLGYCFRPRSVKGRSRRTCSAGTRRRSASLR